jgi:hypothetical protein
MNKVKVKVTLTCYWRRRGGVKVLLYTYVLNIGAREVCVVKATPPLLLPQEKKSATEGLIPLSLQVRAQVTNGENA